MKSNSEICFVSFLEQPVNEIRGNNILVIANNKQLIAEVLVMPPVWISNFVAVTLCIVSERKTSRKLVYDFYVAEYKKMGAVLISLNCVYFFSEFSTLGNKISFFFILFWILICAYVSYEQVDWNDFTFFKSLKILFGSLHRLHSFCKRNGFLPSFWNEYNSLSRKYKQEVKKFYFVKSLPFWR